jgi:hypothetical protein
MRATHKMSTLKKVVIGVGAAAIVFSVWYFAIGLPSLNSETWFVMIGTLTAAFWAPWVWAFTHPR